MIQNINGYACMATDIYYFKLLLYLSFENLQGLSTNRFNLAASTFGEKYVTYKTYRNVQNRTESTESTASTWCTFKRYNL